jgi:ribosomal protein L40E
MHLALNMVAFLMVLVVGWVLFFCWVIAFVFRTLFSVLRGFLRPRSRNWTFPRSAATAQRCPGLRCGATNPPAANFCRRCGSPMNRAYAARPSATAGARNRSRWVSSQVSL